MQQFMQQQEIKKLLRAALECSFYLSPKEPGLTYDELLDFGSKVSLQPGEIGDAVPHITTQYVGRAKERLLPNKQSMPLWHVFIFREEPDYRSVEAFDSLYAQFATIARAKGLANAKLDHSAIVEDALSQQIQENDIEVAISISLFTEQFIEEDGILRSLNTQAPFQSPSQAMRQQNLGNRVIQHPERARAYPIVKDIIERRNFPKARPLGAADNRQPQGAGLPVRKMIATGKSVFIGHGKSPVWRELKEFLENRLHLSVDEFNSTPVAGIPSSVRLEQLLDNAAFSFLIMSAEDEQLDGKFHARLNVVHEAGLFQGRLGFRKAIILLEDTCEEFSNIHGLSQIRFPKDNIGAKFEDIRQVLEREGLVEAG